MWSTQENISMVIGSQDEKYIYFETECFKLKFVLLHFELQLHWNLKVTLFELIMTLLIIASYWLQKILVSIVESY